MADRDMQIGFVFTNYNNSAYTKAAVASVCAADKWGDAHVVVVDNASEAADVAALERIGQEHSAVHLILSRENVGYFRGLNIGIEYLREECSAVDHIVIGNNDLIFPDEFIATMRGCADVFLSHAVVAPDLITIGGIHQNPLVVYPISKFRKLIWDLYFMSYGAAVVVKRIAELTSAVAVRPERAADSELHRIPGPIMSGYGACYLLGPLFFRYFKRLCAPTFIMQEEFFLAEQLRSIGQSVYYDPRFVVYHHDHATIDSLPSRRHWEVSRLAHRVYKRYLRLSPEERLSMIRTETR
jgi:GT2 family glycosyltransferase